MRPIPEAALILNDRNNPPHAHPLLSSLAPLLPSPAPLPPRTGPPAEDLLFTILHSDSWEIRLIDSGTLADGGSRHGDRLNSECGMNATGRMGAEEGG